MVPRQILTAPRFLARTALATLGAVLALVLLVVGFVGCPNERARLRQRVQNLERKRNAAEASAARWQAESRANARYLISVTLLLNEVTNRIDQIQQDQQGLTVLTVQGSGDSWRIVKNRAIPQALDRIDAQLRKNREQIGQLETLAATKSAQNQGLEALVERLKRQNEGLGQQLQTLRRNLGALSKKVRTLESEVVKLETEVGEKENVIGEKEKVIDEKESQLTEQSWQLAAAETEKWTRYYIVGTRKELCSLSIIGPCGILKSVRRSRLSGGYVGAFEACGDRCASADARTLLEVPLGRARSGVELLPPRPSGSYAIEKRNSESYLLITKADEFWRSRHLAVIVER